MAGEGAIHKQSEGLQSGVTEHLGGAPLVKH